MPLSISELEDLNLKVKNKTSFMSSFGFAIKLKTQTDLAKTTSKRGLMWHYAGILCQGDLLSDLSTNGKAEGSLVKATLAAHIHANLGVDHSL